VRRACLCGLARVDRVRADRGARHRVEPAEDGLDESLAIHGELERLANPWVVCHRRADVSWRVAETGGVADVERDSLVAQRVRVEHLDALGVAQAGDVLCRELVGHLRVAGLKVRCADAGVGDDPVGDVVEEHAVSGVVVRVAHDVDRVLGHAALELERSDAHRC
jgi:hypothetical protein